MRNVDWAGYGEFSDPLYVTIPYFWGMRNTKAYGLFLDNPAMPMFRFDDDGSGAVVVGAGEGELDYYLFVGPAPADVAAAYGRTTGLPTLPPKWSLGYHQSRYGYASSEEILTVAASLRELKIPTDAIHFDIDYLDRLQMFTWNPATFPNPIEMNATLDRYGFKRVNISEPLLRTDDRLWPYLSAAQFLVGGPGGGPNVTDIWFGSVGWFDFTKPTAARWYIDVLKSFLSTGITATWNDLNEPAANYMVDAIYDFDGERRTDLQGRNLYALHENTLSYQAQLELRPNVRPWILSRAGYAGIQRYAANWGGDQTATFDSMRVSVQMASSMALSGQNQYGHDIGGFMGSPSPELFIRWLELGSFTTFFRNHAINSSAPREPWAFGEPYLSMAREIINERYRLMPYLYSVMSLASRTGIPAVAPTLFHFPGDTATYRQDTEFMLGPSLLVAPVLLEGSVGRTLYLPSGADWFDASSDTRYVGGINVTVAAPLERIPLFVRAGAVIPKGPVMQFAGEQPLQDVHLQLYPGPATTFQMYEDDGVSFDYARGMYLSTAITRADTASGMTCRIERTGGNWIPPAGRSWWLEIHASAAPAAVTSNGVAVPQAASETALTSMPQGWVRRSDGRVIVRVADAASAIDVVLAR
jgi:alpha-glucosidase